MFMNESTENLLDNLENELTEVIALDNPTKVLTTAEIETEKMPPIPVKRNFASFEDLPEARSHPIPAARRLQSMDKNEKNDENEIIQLSSISSSSASEIQKNYSENTVVKASERKGSSKFVHEAVKVPNEESFFVVKHGKWAQDEDTDRKKVPEDEQKVPTPMKMVQPKLEVFSETPKKASKKTDKTPQTSQRKSSLSSCTSPTKTSVDSSSETSSSSEESVKVRKKSKKRPKDKSKKKSKKKTSSDEQATSTENSVKENQTKVESSQAIGKLKSNFQSF